MGLEETATDSIAAINALIEMFKGKKTEIDNAVTNALESIASPYLTLHVHQINGDDSAQGDFANPLKTVAAAVARIPEFGGGTIYLQDDYDWSESVLVSNRYVLIESNYATITQITTAEGSIGHLNQTGMSKVRFFKTNIKTALFDANVATATNATSFISSIYGGSENSFQHFYADVELGDHSYMYCGVTSHAHSVLGFGHSDITFNPARVAPSKMIILYHTNLSLAVVTSTIPGGESWATLIDGIVRAADSEPRNVIANISV